MRRASFRPSDTKSSDQRWLDPIATGNGIRNPRPFPAPSSPDPQLLLRIEVVKFLVANDNILTFQHHTDPPPDGQWTTKQATFVRNSFCLDTDFWGVSSRGVATQYPAGHRIIGAYSYPTACPLPTKPHLYYCTRSAKAQRFPATKVIVW